MASADYWIWMFATKRPNLPLVVQELARATQARQGPKPLNKASPDCLPWLMQNSPARWLKLSKPQLLHLCELSRSEGELPIDGSKARVWTKPRLVEYLKVSGVKPVDWSPQVIIIL